MITEDLVLYVPEIVFFLRSKNDLIVCLLAYDSASKTRREPSTLEENNSSSTRLEIKMSDGA